MSNAGVHMIVKAVCGSETACRASASEPPKDQPAVCSNSGYTSAKRGTPGKCRNSAKKWSFLCNRLHLKMFWNSGGFYGPTESMQESSWGRVFICITLIFPIFMQFTNLISLWRIQLDSTWNLKSNKLWNLWRFIIIVTVSIKLVCVPFYVLYFLVRLTYIFCMNIWL